MFFHPTPNAGFESCMAIVNRLAVGLDFEFPQKATNELDNSECFSIKSGLDLMPREYKITV